MATHIIVDVQTKKETKIEEEDIKFPDFPKETVLFDIEELKKLKSDLEQLKSELQKLSKPQQQ
ncbi:MAG: hypothetical protein QXG39_04895 [Candidatus Aenigmatarchaeota archaeon]